METSYLYRCDLQLGPDTSQAAGETVACEGLQHALRLPLGIRNMQVLLSAVH